MRHLIDLVQRNDTACFPAGFELTEKLLVQGSPEVQDWIGVGVLEGIQNQLANQEISYPIMEPWLGPETRAVWDAFIEAWGG